MVTYKRCLACDRRLEKGQSTVCNRRCRGRLNGMKAHYEVGTAEFEDALARRRDVWRAQDDGLYAPPPGKKLHEVHDRKLNQPDQDLRDEYEVFKAQGYGPKMRDGTFTGKDVYGKHGWSYQKINRLFQRWLDEVERAEAAERGELGYRAQQCLTDFAMFRATYFTDLSGTPYTHTEHHQRWTDAVMVTLDRGGLQLVLAPPRHGKTELLIHLCIWLILRNPNIRILWIGGNGDIAKQSLAAIKDELEFNEKLKGDYLAEGMSFRPGKMSGKVWSSDKFKVATSTATGAALKSPTMVAVGKGGKLLSRDADIIIGDDIDDHESASTPSSRDDLYTWLTTQVISRKEEHTSVFLIGSRQNYEDLYGRLVENQMWRHVVDSAHDPECDLPEHEFIDADHLVDDCDVCKAHKDCVLWPEKRRYGFLQQQRISYENDLLYDMVYNNRVVKKGVLYVTWDDIKELWDDRSVGQFPKGRDGRQRDRSEFLLIAGLDPAAANDQAAFLWAYDAVTHARYAIDLDVAPAGGLPGAREIIRRWWFEYGVGWWVIEKNNYQGAIMQDREVMDFASRHGIRMSPTFTSNFNKHDPAMGVSAMLQNFKEHGPDRKVFLPGGDPDSRMKFSKYARQVVNFDGSTRAEKRAKARTDDLLMASWFPELKFRPLARELAADVRVQQRGPRTSYAGSMAGSYSKMALN